MKDYNLSSKFFQFENLRELLRHGSEVYKDRTAFVTKVKDRKTKEVSYINHSYVDLFVDTMNLGTGISSLGLENVAVGLIGENSYKWCLSYFAVPCGIGTIVPLDKLLQKEEIVSCLRRSKCKLLIVDEKHYQVAKEIIEEGSTQVVRLIGIDFIPENSFSVDQLIEIGHKKLDEGYRDFVDFKIDNDKMNFLLFTSGTTSNSKAVMLSHKNFMSCNYGMNCEELFFKDDVNMIILPLHHCYGMSGLLTFLSQGMKNVFCDGLRYIVPNLKEYKVTVFMSVPLLLENMYKKIELSIKEHNLEKKIERGLKICNTAQKLGINLRRKVFRGIIDNLGGHLRFIINGAAALDPRVSKGFNDFGILTVQGYGLTETAPTIASESYRYLKPGSVGKVMPNVTAKILKENQDGIGELVVRGENVMLGYYDDKGATDEVIVDGWFHTGDLAYFDKEDYLFICGRKKNVIVMKNGKNVYPEEIEALMNTLPYVLESFVFGKSKGSDLVLWSKIVYDKDYLKKEGLSLDELEKKLKADMEDINSSMPSYKMVKHWFLSDIPTIKTTTQKTKRRDEEKVALKEIESL